MQTNQQPHGEQTWLESRVPKLITYFSAHDRLTNQEYCRVFSVTRSTATKELKRLCDEGFLVAVGVRKGAHYTIGSMLNHVVDP
jgi:Fic family protein